MDKLNQRLTLIANISVVLGIVFLAMELRQNTQAIQAQTRDSITEKQMEYYSWVAMDRPLAELAVRVQQGTSINELDPTERFMFGNLWRAVVREWENSHYQYERGLFTGDEFEARVGTWRFNMSIPAFRENWANQRESFAPSFRAEIDAIVADVGG